MGKKFVLGMGALLGFSILTKKDKKKQEQVGNEELKAIEKHNAEIATQKEKEDDIIRFNRRLQEAKEGVERAKTIYEKRHDNDWLEIQHEFEAEVRLYEAELKRLAS